MPAPDSFRDLISKRRSLALKILRICRERERRRTHPSRGYKPADHPNRNQLAFHQSKANVRLILGGNQSGKSKAAAHELLWFLDGSHPWMKTPRNPRIYVISAEYRTIQEGVYKHLMGSREGQIPPILPDWKISTLGPKVPKWDVHSYIEYRTPHGLARVDFLSGHGSESSRKKAQAAECDVVFIDEEISQGTWEELQARRLKRGGKVVISATAYLSDQWFTDLEDRALSGDPNVHLTRLLTEQAVADGHLDRGVFDEMLTHLSKEEADVRLRGQTRKSQHLIYPEFCADHVVKPFEIPESWARYMAIDPGWRTCAVLWAAVSPDDKVYFYRELYEHQAHYLPIVEKICAMEGWVYDPKTNRYHEGQATEQIDTRWIDPAAFGHSMTGEPGLGHLIAQYGLSCAPAFNAVDYGIELVKRAMMSGLDGVPRLRVFSSLTNFLYEVRSYRRQRDDPGEMRNAKTDRPIKKKDHLMDCARYLLSGQIEARRVGNSYYEQAARKDRRDPAVPSFLSGSARGRKMWQSMLEERRREWDFGSASASVGMGSER